MKVFLSWSGSMSRQLARILREWLPYVVPNIKPWMSEDDIPKGSGWWPELAEHLAATPQGVVCVTRDNVHSPWLNFEAGSLAKTVGERAYVRPLLLDVGKADVTGPLANFQATTVTDRRDMLRMITSLNELSSDPHPESRLHNVFDKWWDEFAKQVVAIDRPEQPASAPKRSDRDLLEEILNLVRGLSPQAPDGTGGGAGVSGIPRVSSVERAIGESPPATQIALEHLAAAPPPGSQPPGGLHQGPG